jgi:hypothetical protein
MAMSMVSEIATEENIKVFVEKIKKELKRNNSKPDVCVVLKELGRFALTQFEWSTPDWAKEYHELFKR